MSNKSIIIVSGIAVAALFIGVGAWFFSRGQSVDKPNVSVVEQQVEENRRPDLECSEILGDQRIVNVHVEKKPLEGMNEYEFVVELETFYPANVATIALSYNPRDWKFIRTEADTSVFPIEAPGEELSGFVKMSRGISGKGAGLTGSGEFARAVFQRIGQSGAVSDPVLVEEQSAIFLNNGCAARGKIQVL